MKLYNFTSVEVDRTHYNHTTQVTNHNTGNTKCNYFNVIIIIYKHKQQ